MSYSSFLGLNVAMRGLLAQQAALDTTSHNIGNINTEGYSRQRADLTAASPMSVAAFNRIMPGQIGQGVEVLQIQRLRDQYVDRTMRSQIGLTSNLSTQLSALQAAGSVINEPSDSGLGAALRRFFGSLDDVAAHPSDVATRQVFLESARTLAAQFNQLNTNLSAISAESNERLDQTVADVNSLVSRIATLNSQIRDATQIGQQPNDLLDTRDRLMDQLASKVNFTYTTSATTNEVTITFGTATPINLVDPSAAGGMNAITRADLDAAYVAGDLTGGQGYADEHLLTTVIPGLITQLDDLASSIATAFNAQQAAGFDLTGAAGAAIFTGVTAGSITVTSISAREIAAASSWSGAGEPGNNGNIMAMLSLRSATQGAPLNDTWEGFYGAMVSGLGATTQSVENRLEDQMLVQDAIEARRQSTSGVNLDEEMTNMLRFQHAYNAAARVLTMFDESLDVLINRTGRVGL